MIDRELLEHLSRALAPVEERLVTPALVIDLDAAAHNIAAMLRRVGSPARWRPHVKTLKSSALIRLLLELGVRRFKCATLPELELVLDTAAAWSTMARARGDYPRGVKASRGPRPLDEEETVEVLLAFPGSRAVYEGAMALQARHPGATVQLLADSPAHAAAMDEWLARATDRDDIPLLLDVDIGMGRTGSSSQRWAEGLETVAKLRRLRLLGLHAYEGHVTWEQRAEAEAGYDQLCELAGRLPEPPALIVTSGSHSFGHALGHPGLNGGPWLSQVSPGTIVLSDTTSAPAAADLGLLPAALVASRVISAPRRDRVTLDAGSKGVSPDRPAAPCRVLGWPRLETLAVSEEHLVLGCGTGPRPTPGTLLWLLPAHVCTTVNLYREALWLSGGALVGSGRIEAAGRRLLFD